MKGRLLAVAIIAIMLLIVSTSYLYSAGVDRDYNVHIIRADDREIAVQAEIADTIEERSYGLMNRASLEEDAGMIFIFEEAGPHSFWMKNTLIPLDMIFIAENMTIVDIHKNATPLSEEPIIPCADCKYVLEVNGGFCDKNGITIGDKVEIDMAADRH